MHFKNIYSFQLFILPAWIPVKLTKVYGTTDVLQQTSQLSGLQVGECCLVLGDPLVQVSKFALNGLLRCPLPWLQLGVFRISVKKERYMSNLQECNVYMLWLTIFVQACIWWKKLWNQKTEQIKKLWCAQQTKCWQHASHLTPAQTI